jgi:hypothetical protein
MRFTWQVAVRCRAEWRRRYQHFLAQGRAKKEALTILSRSLLKIIYHLLRTGTRLRCNAPALGCWGGIKTEQGVRKTKGGSSSCTIRTARGRLFSPRRLALETLG